MQNKQAILFDSSRSMYFRIDNDKPVMISIDRYISIEYTSRRFFLRRAHILLAIDIRPTSILLTDKFGLQIGAVACFDWLLFCKFFFIRTFKLHWFIIFSWITPSIFIYSCRQTPCFVVKISWIIQKSKNFYQLF